MGGCNIVCACVRACVRDRYVYIISSSISGYNSENNV